MKIKPYTKNAKKHTDEQVAKIARSIERFGMNQPIVVDKDGVIIVGHGRYMALQKLGWEIKPEYILQKDDLTESEVAAYRLADNKLNESSWDMDLVMSEWSTLDDELKELSGLSMDLIEPDIPFDDIDENNDRAKKAKQITVSCPHCKEQFEFLV